MTFGFGFLGLIFSLCIMLPNVIFYFFKPSDMKEYSHKEALFFDGFEWVGRIACLLLPCFFAEYSDMTVNSFSVFCILAFVCVLIYWAVWCRYFFGQHTMVNLFRPLGKFIVPLAILPVLSYFLFGIWGKNIFVILASIVFGVGHITNSWLMYQATRRI